MQPWRAQKWKGAPSSGLILDGIVYLRWCDRLCWLTADGSCSHPEAVKTENSCLQYICFYCTWRNTVWQYSWIGVIKIHRGLYFGPKMIFIPPFLKMIFFHSLAICHFRLPSWPFCLNSSLFCIYFTLLLPLFSFFFTFSPFFSSPSHIFQYIDPCKYMHGPGCLHFADHNIPRYPTVRVAIAYVHIALCQIFPCYMHTVICGIGWGRCIAVFEKEYMQKKR